MLFASETIGGRNLRTRMEKVRLLFRVMGVRIDHILLPVFFSFLIALFSGVGLGLLIPLVKGLSSGDFSTVSDMPILGRALTYTLAVLNASDTSNQIIFLVLIGFVLAVQVCRNVILYAQLVYNAYWNGIFRKRIASGMFKRYLSFGQQFFDRESQGKLQTTLAYSNEVLWLLNVIQTTSASLFQVLARFVVMLCISWQLSLSTALILPLLYIAVRIKANKIRHISRERREAHMQLARETFNTLSGITLVKSYAREKEMADRFEALTESFRKLDMGAQSLYALAQPAQELIILAAFSLIIYFAGSVFEGATIESVSLLVVFLYAANGMLPQFATLGKAGLTVADLSAPVGNVIRVFDDEGKFQVPQGDREFKGLQHQIEYRDLTFAYQEDQPVLQELTFTVQKNTTVALVGPSGAGKTTILNLLLRLYDCPERALFVDGEDIRNFTHQSLQQHIAYVSQEPILFNDTIRYNMTFGLDRDVSDTEVRDAAQKARILDFIESLPRKFETEVGDRGMQLSGGEKQRLALARALLKGAGILALDEATSSLDSQTERLIQEAIDEAVQGRTAIVIAHRLSTIQNAEKIVVIRDGRVVEEGALSQLLEQKGFFSKLWQAQQFY
ncbi:MAG: ABC transporter ATP-binding protein [Candidatus Peribacteraceae bacterium]|nr:ABC transporter ATP-binding protein [Candidatus Peribacteraceae bacterium]